MEIYLQNYKNLRQKRLSSDSARTSGQWSSCTKTKRNEWKSCGETAIPAVTGLYSTLRTQDWPTALHQFLKRVPLESQPSNSVALAFMKSNQPFQPETVVGVSILRMDGADWTRHGRNLVDCDTAAKLSTVALAVRCRGSILTIPQ